jgi:acyl-CoA thioester hydrolase/thioesterase-3
MNTIFSSEIKVRPDDIDLNNHLHNAKYLDYVQAGRFEQMVKDYKMPMEEFIEKGYNWVASAANINWKRPLKLGDTAIVNTMVSVKSGRPVRITDEIIERYSI